MLIQGNLYKFHHCNEGCIVGYYLFHWNKSFGDWIEIYIAEYDFEDKKYDNLPTNLAERDLKRRRFLNLNHYESISMLTKPNTIKKSHFCVICEIWMDNQEYEKHKQTFTDHDIIGRIK